MMHDRLGGVRARARVALRSARMDLKRTVALVTGASSGIGLATARALVARGARVALVARTELTLARIVRELGSQAESFPLDVTDHAALRALPARVAEHFGGLDVVVNNAGVNHRGPLRKRTAEEIEQVLSTNLVAPALLTHAALPYLRAGAVIINVASLAGKVPVPDEAAYSASKAGVRAFSRALGVELAGDGVRVVCINPGPVDTGFFGDVHQVPDLVFSQPMSSADQVANAVLRAIERDIPAGEIDVPRVSGKLATLGYLSPRLFAVLRPLFEKRGAKNKARYVARKRMA
jgi:NAD(P)-dependent dehydrogenase (short-subunit alcohol dehydrogenase family)